MPRAAAAGRESKFGTEEEERAAGAAGADDGDDVGGPLLPDRAASLVGPLLPSWSLESITEWVNNGRASCYIVEIKQGE